MDPQEKKEFLSSKEISHSLSLVKPRWTDDKLYFIKNQYEKFYDWDIVIDKFSKEYRTATYSQVYNKMRKWIPTLNRDTNPNTKIDFILWANNIYRLYEFIELQLKEYNKVGKRLYSFTQILEMLKIGKKNFVKYSKKYLSFLFDSEKKGDFYYSLLFGMIRTSYQDLLRKCKKVNYTLLKPDSQEEWFGMLKNRGNIAPSWLYIKVECERGHPLTKRNSSLDNVLSNNAKGCKLCQYENQETTFDDCEKLAKKQGIKFGLNLEQFTTIIAVGKAKGLQPSLIPLKWECPNPDCGYSWWRNIEFTHSSLAGCSICNEKSRKNQLLTFKVCNFIFEDILPNRTFRYEHPLSQIFRNKTEEERRVYERFQFYFTVHFDLFDTIIINDRVINLAIEQQGKQHENTEAGWKYFYNLSRKHGTKRDWEDLLGTDKSKVELINCLNELNKKGLIKEEYYLIEVWHHLNIRERQDFIINQFKLFTGIDLSNKPIYNVYDLSK